MDITQVPETRDESVEKSSRALQATMLTLESPLVQKAALQAAADFEGVTRKVPRNSSIEPKPYFSHVQKVALLLAEHGYDSEVVAAGYLHDHLEDLPESWSRARMKLEFNERVTALVDWVTQQDKSASWEQRNKDYFERIQLAPAEALAISAADKISNIEDTLETLRQGFPVESVLKRGWRVNSEKFHELLTLFEGRVDQELLNRLRHSLEKFDSLGSKVTNNELIQCKLDSNELSSERGSL